MFANDSPGLDTLESRFARFAVETHGRSPLYQTISELLSEDAAPAQALADAPPGQRRPTLWLAALHEVLLDHADEPLAAWYPSCGGDRSPDEDGLWDALVGAVERHGDRIAAAVRTRNTQTNEIGRSAGLRLVLSEVVQRTDRPVALVELGTAAGLLLMVDRIAHRFDRIVAGPADPSFTLDVTMRAESRPARVADDLRIAARVGLDLEPRDPADPATASWLRACVWPEHTHRRARLDDALALARSLDDDPATAIRAHQVEADITTPDLEQVVRAQPDDCAVVLWSSSALAYIPQEHRDAMPGRLAALGAERELWQGFAEGPFLPPFAELDERLPEETDNPTWNAVGLTRWSGEDAPQHRLLARMGPHGDWVRWLDLRAG